MSSRTDALPVTASLRHIELDAGHVSHIRTQFMNLLTMSVPGIISGENVQAVSGRSGSTTVRGLRISFF